MSILDRVHILAQRLLSTDSCDDKGFRAIMADFEFVTNVNEFARKFGMSRPTINRWKNGHSVPHPALRPRIYRHLHKLADTKIQELTIR